MEHLKKHLVFIRTSIELRGEINRLVTPEEIDAAINICSSVFPEQLKDDERAYIKFTLGNQFTLDLSHKGTVLNNPDVKRWLDNAKTDIEWNYWNAFNEFLQNDEGRPIKVIEENERIIDSILDLSGNPQIEGAWARKGLVMGNVQSGKTQNYIGLINKAMDSGYKVIILLGGHMNNLRKQTQVRVDEGVIGRESTHIVSAHLGAPKRIGVGKYRTQDVATATSSDEKGDFNKNLANNLGIAFNNLKDPIILTVKKNHSILKNLYEWIKTKHLLDPEDGKKLDLPLLFIDDEADWASINSKAHRKEITATNKSIREILGLFNRSTYVAYTATPFANIFIDPDSADEMYGDDLFPKDFMIRVPVPDVYLGQNFYFQNQDHEKINPVEIIEDNEDMLPLKHNSMAIIGPMAPSLQDAIRTFIISNSLRDARGDEKEDKTMMINITHFNALQGQLTMMIDDYLKKLKNSIESAIGDKSNRLNNSTIQEFQKTFNTKFDVNESFEDVLNHIRKSINKIKVFGINTQSAQVLDYDLYPDGLSAIVIGGHKLSRGLTLSGLSVSYFARNSKAYDTLMQMCRWFGYRPNYGDLCKVFLPIESNDWYSFIAEAIDELYLELETMSLQEKTPMDFGLKVRSHPSNLIVTAKYKAGNVQNSIVSIDMWGTRERRFTFLNDNDVNDHNLDVTKTFYKKISETNGMQKVAKNNSLLIENVDHQDIINYLKSTKLIESSLGDRALFEQINTMQENDLPKFKVLVKSIETGNKKLFWQKDHPDKKMLKEYDFCGENINLQKRSFKSNGKVLKFPSAEAGSFSDEKMFLSELEIKRLLKDKPNASNIDFVKSPERDFPVLIIYMFSISTLDPYTTDLEKINSIEIPFKNPTVGLSFSFPALENYKDLSNSEIKKLNNDSKISYDMNAIAQIQQKEISPNFTEEDFLED
jgi:hypothetical protein